ncbi:MAG TPA: hypothetical protein VFF20_10205 [Pseudogracilibacillus sp.]|nr:hypothetical protein [Pseudogracilibacillus sp.]
MIRKTGQARDASTTEFTCDPESWAGKLTSAFAANACTPLAVAPAKKRPAEVTSFE